MALVARGWQSWVNVRTHHVVVLAADDLGVALLAGANANNVDGVALEPDERVDALDCDADEAKERGGGRVLGLQFAMCVRTLAHRNPV